MPSSFSLPKKDMIQNIITQADMCRSSDTLKRKGGIGGKTESKACRERFRLSFKSVVGLIDTLK